VDVIRSIILEESSTITNTIGSSTIKFNEVEIDKEYIGKNLGAIKMKPATKIFGIVKNGSFIFAEPDLKIDINDKLVVAQKVD
jgi:K+/H+ antiporter YhaU regulatory subunit KhtT